MEKESNQTPFLKTSVFKESTKKGLRLGLILDSVLFAFLVLIAIKAGF
tara:strand:- start:6867 stop:7010 length:144 start_codon:yes stop_codon:yes gene_type:complete